MLFKIVLGATVRDAITGYGGVVTGRADYITGCNQYLVQPERVTKDGAVVSAQWFDEHRLLVDDGAELLSLPKQPAGRGGSTGQAPIK